MTNIEMILFDLDGTLYPKNHPLIDLVRNKTKSWIASTLSISMDEVEEIYSKLPESFPHPYFGFQSLGLSPKQYLDNVFDNVDPSASVNADSSLIDLFSELPGDKHVVTLSSDRYANQLLTALGIAHFFKSVKSLINFDPSYNKIDVYEQLRGEAGLNCNQVLIVGDNYENDLRDAELSGYGVCLVDLPISSSQSHGTYLSELIQNIVNID